MSKITYYQRNRDVTLNRAKDYYKYDKERLRDNTRDKYRNLLEQEKSKKREYERNRYHNISEEKKQKLKEYQKNYREANKLKSLKLIKKIHDCIHEKLLILLIFFLASICTVLDQ